MAFNNIKLEYYKTSMFIGWGIGITILQLVKDVPDFIAIIVGLVAGLLALKIASSLRKK